ncbi:MAG TPA: sulfatase, partial [Polyangia bacterium]
MQRSRAWVSAEDVTAGLAGVALLGPIELLLLSRSPSGGFPAASWAVAGLFVGLGVLVGLGLSLGRSLAQRIQRPWLAALLQALPALLVLVPSTRTLFDGAWAATLPGARTGFIWVPAIGVAGIALAIHFGRRLLARPYGRAVLGIALPGLAVEIDLCNRSVLASEYADLHTLLLVTAVVLAGLGARFFCEAFHPFGWTWPKASPTRRLWGVGFAALGLSALALFAGLAGKASRRAIADDGMHGRLLDRAAKEIFDFDRDGHASVLGGRDCRAFDADVHPEAQEINDNGVDEDCDGEDRAPLVGLDGAAARRRQVEAWRRDPAVSAFAKHLSRLNVVFIAVDALRADPFAPTAENAAAFPNIFALRRRASWFPHAFSTAAGTDLGMAGVMTGRINPLSGAELTLAEALTAAGYSTHALVPAEVLRSASRTLLTRGFGKVEVLETDGANKTASGISADRTTAQALAFLDRWKGNPKAPFFLWAHYFDVHEHAELPATEPAIVASNRGVPPSNRVEKYRALISVVDGAIGRLREGLAARGLADNTLLVFFADHGESMHEDRRLPENHGRFVYNALVNVPLGIIVPGVEPGELNAPVSLLDVPATLLDLIGAAGAAGDIDGESLLPHLLGAPPAVLQPPRIIPLNETDQYGIIAWPHKLLVRPDANLVELFDLSRDFKEQVDQAEEQPALVQRLQQWYRGLPSLHLDRTIAARRRWEIKAEATRPSHAELARLGRRLRPAGEAANGSWLPGAQPALQAKRPEIAIANATSSRERARSAGTPTLGRRQSSNGGAAAPPAPASSIHAGIVIEPLRRPGATADRHDHAPASIALPSLPVALPPPTPVSAPVRRRPVASATQRSGA